MVKDVENSILTLISETTVWLAQKITTAIEEHGQPDLERPWFDDLYGTIRALAAMVALIALLVSVLFAALSRDGGELGRTLVRVLTAGLTTGLVVVIVMLAHRLIDEFCVMVLGEGGWDAVTNRILTPVGYLWKVSRGGSPEQPFVLMVLLSLALLFAFAVIWVEMVIRRMLIDLCVMMWPLAAAGSVWSGARVWTARLRDTIISLLLVKLIIIMLLRMSAGLLESADSPDDLLVAVGLFWLGAFSPFLVAKLIGLVNGALSPGGTGEGLRQAAAGATMAAAGKAVGMVSRLAAKGAGAAGGAMMGGGRTPMPQLGEPGQQETTPPGGEQNTPAERGNGAVKPIDAEVLRRMGHPVHIPHTGAGNSPPAGSSPGSGPGRHARPQPATPQASPQTTGNGNPVPASHGAPPATSTPNGAPPPASTPNGTPPASTEPGSGAPPPAAPLPPSVQRTYTPVPAAVQPPLGGPPPPPGPGRTATPPPPPLPPRTVRELRGYEGAEPVPAPPPPPSSPPAPDPPPPPPKEQP
ncbi:hypothetical protein HS048_34615 [Planomonospora sp. ID91781]|uniref:proline-rich domain-containing protein n=1 Tax=Planomonospora sp. ID91781 TaxID=2738135 RepID=UPI0018C3E8D4|nr:proline-rich domain-containing protein [Planomonospora sp. ID91781]MBG0825819.1 hypothetical protein [Planomonospora sp. ID91781]